jgi:hypothetical protein
MPLPRQGAESEREGGAVGMALEKDARIMFRIDSRISFEDTRAEHFPFTSSVGDLNKSH